MPNFARENNSVDCAVDNKVLFAQGAFKNVYKGAYTTGSRKGERCVVKVFKSGSVFESSFFDSEIKVVDKALEIVNMFNSTNVVDQSVWLNMPTVWEYTEGNRNAGENCLVEPMIQSFKKFNSNTGWVPDEKTPWANVMQALSHYSYHATYGKLLLCDLQGGVCTDGFIITDPVVISNTQEYGPTDLGCQGISTFFAKHVCSKFCKSGWKSPVDKRAYFKTQQGSAMITRTAVNAIPRFDSGYGSMNQLHGLLEGLELVEE